MSRGANMRAQISMEFLMVFSLLLVLFLILFSFAGDVSKDMRLKKERLSALNTVDYLALSMNLVYQAGDGALLNVSVRPGVLDGNYNVSVIGRNVLIFWDGFHYSSPLLSDSVNFTASNSTDFSIRNIEGVVVVG